MKDVNTISFTKRNLPHWLVADRTLFVTIRLKGSLPISVVQELKVERDKLCLKSSDNEQAINEFQRRQFVKIEAALDVSLADIQWMKNPEVADIVFENLAWLEETRGWQIKAACVMPTHVHIIMRNTEGRTGELLSDLGQYKNFSARKANKILKRTGPFWATEDFDHWCRTEDKVESVIKYIRNNPVKAGLVKKISEWKWVR